MQTLALDVLLVKRRSIEPGGPFGHWEEERRVRSVATESGWVTYMEIGAPLWRADKRRAPIQNRLWHGQEMQSDSTQELAVGVEINNGFQTVQTSASVLSLIEELGFFSFFLKEVPFSTMLHLSFCGAGSSFYRHCFLSPFTSTVFYRRLDTKVDQRDILLREGTHSDRTISTEVESPLIANHMKCAIQLLYCFTSTHHFFKLATRSEPF